MKTLQYILFALVSLTLLTSCIQPVPTTEESETGEPEAIILGVNAYSFSDLLMAKNDRDGQQVYTLFNLLDWCADRGIRALDPTAYFFPTYPEVPSDEYLEKFKNHAASLGIAISGTGIRNNFASPDPAVRAEGVELAKKWIVAASKLGAPVLRVFAGAIPEGYEDNWEEPAQWMIGCYKELIPYAERYGVKIGIQNHGDMLQTARQCIYILEAVDSKWAGLILDTGSFNTEDPYQDIAAMVPYTISWQVKESPWGIGGKEKTDYVKLIRIIKEGGYSGYLPVETLLVRGVPYDPFARVTGMLDELEAAMQEEGNRGTEAVI
jgi:sugar phosphate isomerase/epimerase